jgi:hypothetical protein
MKKNKIYVFCTAVFAVFVIAFLFVQNEGEARVRWALKDSDSAKFRNGFTTTKKEEKIFCGEVNAKNEYGAYGGFKKYVVVDRAIFVGDYSVIYDGDGETFFSRVQSISSSDLVRDASVHTNKLTAYVISLKLENKEIMHKSEQVKKRLASPEVFDGSLADVAWEEFCT